MDQINTTDRMNWKANFDHLVEELAYNYYACSFGDAKPIDDKVKPKISKLILKREQRVEKQLANKSKGTKDDNSSINFSNYRTRNILVVGAGSSMDSYTGMPGGETLIQRFKLEKEKYFQDSLLKRYEQDKKEIQSITGRDNLSFENYLYIMSRAYMTQTEMRDLIDDYTNFRYSPVFFNEIIAHMLKHSFLDAVINFNFEETLDQAISEEIGEGNYYNIISDGHCIDLDSITSNGTLKTPIYIKPHGTNSHKSTLRFTNKHYFDIPDDISRMMKCLIGGFESSKSIDKIIKEYNKDSRQDVESFGNELNEKGIKQRTIDKVNLIVVGFNMESIEFLDILNNYLPTSSDIYYINYKEPEEELYREVYYKRLADFFISKDSEKLKEWNSKEIWERDTSKLVNQNFVKDIFDKLRGNNLGFKFIQCSDKYEIELDNKSKVIIGNCLENYENDIIQAENKSPRNKNNRESTWQNSLPPLGRLFNYAFSDIYTSFSKPYIPQHIHRHKFVNLLFHDSSLRKTYDYKNPAPKGQNRLKLHIKKQIELRSKFESNYLYYLDRTIVEIAISFLRGHGAIDYFELKHGRVRTYYKLYIKHVKNYNLLNQSNPVDIVSLARLVLTFTNVNDKDQIALNIVKINQEDVFKKDGKKHIFKTEVFNRLDSKYNTSFIHNSENGLKKELIDFYEDKGVFKIPKGNKPYNQNNRRLAITIIFKLFSHDYISGQFLSIRNSRRLFGIQRIKIERNEENYSYRYVEMTHLQMIIHSANYLVGNNFYSISTQSQNSDLITWQSFNLHNQLHTNLKLDYELNKKLDNNKNNEYNIVFSVSEVGNNVLYNLKYSPNSILNANNQIVQICSYEAIMQLHPPKFEDSEAEYITRLIVEHKKYLLKIESEYSKFTEADKSKFNRLILLFIPFTLHNHHMTLFSKVEMEHNEIIIKHNSAIYIWRRGFSTQMNPILMTKIENSQCTLDEHDQYNAWVENDLKSLFNIFIKYLDRGLLFNVLHSIQSSKFEGQKLNDTNKVIRNNLAKIEESSGISFKLDNIPMDNLNYLMYLDPFNENNLNEVREKFLNFIYTRRLQ